MKIRKVVVALLAGTVLLCTGCKTLKDVISWTPFWWVVNLKRVDNPGGLRPQPEEVATRNFFDGGKRYVYHLDSGKIVYRVDEDTSHEWKRLQGGNPRGCDGSELTVLRLATDNNRIFVLAENSSGMRSLWWYVHRRDDAVWAGILIYAAGDFMKQGYADWFDCAHTRDSVWVNVLALRTFVPYKEPHIEKTVDASGKRVFRVAAFNAPRSSINVDDIVDIAVGNWGGTVVTFYVLMGSTGKIMYIDEEIIMDRWKEVPNTVLPTKYSPYPLDSTARIAASNSVIAVYFERGDSAHINWLRWDYHNPQDFDYYPLNWCEDDWRRIACPLRGGEYFNFDSHWPDEVHDTIWNVPKGIERVFNEVKTVLPGQVAKKMKKKDWQGCFADYNSDMISQYYLAFDVVKGDSTCSLRTDNLKYPDQIAMSDWSVTVTPPETPVPADTLSKSMERQ